MTDAPATPLSRFRMEDALQATFSAVAANLGVFMLLALVLSAAPNAVAQLLLRGDMSRPGSGSGLFVTGVFLKPLVALATAAVLQGALTRGVLDHLNGTKPRFALCLRTGLVQAPALVAISLIFGVAVGIGMILLLVPGLFLVSLWTPAGAVRVAERRGVFGAFGRAAELTQGHRWAVLIVMVVVVVLGAIVGGVLSGVVNLLAAGGGGALALLGAAPLTPVLALVVALNAVIAAAVSLLTNAAPVAIYAGLRRAREGAGPEELADLFD